MILSKNRLKEGCVDGCKRGWSGFVWMLKIIVPISFLTMLIEYSGLIPAIDFLLKPVMGTMHLPSVAALPIISGLLTGIYGGVASMAVLPLNIEQMTLIAVFLLISHNIIQEGIIQAKSGISFFRTTMIRISASIVITILVSRVLTIPESALAAENGLVQSHAFWGVLQNWIWATLRLCLKMFIIIMALMIILETMKKTDVIRHIVHLLKPVLRVMGLERNVGVLWLTAVVFGLSYGAAVIVEEVREGNFSPDELESLHVSIGINHAMVEDPALFLPFGISPLWLWLPRIVGALLAVHCLHVYRKFRKGRPELIAQKPI